MWVLAAWAAAEDEGVGRVVEREGGLLPCEPKYPRKSSAIPSDTLVPGDAVTRRRPDPIIVLSS